MNAKSQGPEIQVELNPKEFKILKNKVLNGILEFSDLEENKKNIKFSLDYREHQKKFVECSQSPQGVYFGSADSVSFSINSFFYSRLESHDYYGSRFYGAAGKLEIKIED